jgi:replication factor A1
MEEVIDIPPAFPMYTYSLTPMYQLPQRVEVNKFFTGIPLYA